MITALSFSSATHKIKLPPMSEGIGNGIIVTVWVRRTGTGSRQRIIQFGTAASEYFVLGTGDNPSDLAIGIERGATRSEMVCEGALPQNRWVKVTAIWFPLFQLVQLSVFDILLEQKQVGAFPTGEFVDNSIAGGVLGSPFVGQLSNLEILQPPVPSWFGPSAPATVWAKYPLSGTVYKESITNGSVETKLYRVDDVSAKNNDGIVAAWLGKSTWPDDYGLGQVPVLEMTGDPKTLFLSPVTGLSGALTLETWFNPISTKDRQSMIILADDKDVSLVVTVGGDSENGGGHIDAMLCQGNNKIRLLDCAYGENAGTFQHVALTLGRGAITGGMVPIVMSLYLNGQLLTSRTVVSNRIVTPMFGNGAQYLPLLRLMHSPAIPNVRLGGTIAGFSKFTGQLSEFRVWNSCRTAQEIAGNFLSRLIGNEAGLLACYRLEQSQTGCVFDISEHRGVGTLQPGCTIGTASNLPLLYTSNPSAAYLRVKGKLITEQLTYMAEVLKPVPASGGLFDPTGNGGIDIVTAEIVNVAGIVSGANWTLVKEPRTGPLTVFDALLAPTTPDGSSQAGKTIQICPDADVRVYLPNSDNVYVPTKWPAKQVQSLTVPENGKLRLRIEATTLFCPTLRARFSDMVEGLWTLVRPDSEAMQSLASTSGSTLRTPPSGKASPLPASATDEDANLCATALGEMGRCYRPIAYSPPPLVGQNRSIWGSIGSAIDSAVDFTEDTASTVSSGLKKAGSSAGRFAESLVDNGSAALSQASSVVKKTSSLLCSASDELRELTSAANQAVPRFGQDQIKQCIATADRLAILATAATNTIAHTFSIIGTSIIDGTSYVWRVVVNGVMDAYHAVVGFLQKVGAQIEKVLKYLAWLFNWNDFLKASDKIYSTIEGSFGTAKAQLAKVSGYKDELRKYLTLPAGIGDKSLAQHCGIDIPDNLGAEEIDYVMDIANTVMSATNLDLGFMNQLSQQAGAGTSLVDTTKLKALNLSSSVTESPISNPVALLTTPLTQLINSLTTGDSQTSVLDFLFDQLTHITDTILSSAQTMLTARLKVPNVTSWVESTILGGRTLSLLRIASLVAAIAQVLAVKISANAKSGKAEPQPVSFADDSQPADYSAQVWSNFALSVLSSLIEIPRSMIELAIAKSGDPEKAEKLASVQLAAWNTGLGLVGLARSALNYYANARLPKDIQWHLGYLAAVDAVSAGFLIMTSWSKAYFYSSNDTLFVTLIKVLEFLGQSVAAVLSIGLAAAAAQYRSLFQTALDWTAFGFQMGSYVVNQAGQLATAYIDLTASIKNAKKLSPYVPIGLSVTTTLLDLGSGITNAVQSA